jgi:hypothetical protein
MAQSADTILLLINVYSNDAEDDSFTPNIRKGLETKYR